jgi:Right handed beta helix region
MAESRRSHGGKKWNQRWWIVGALGLVPLAAACIATAYVVADDDSTASRSSSPKPATAPRSTVPPSSALTTSGACGPRQAATAPRPSGRDDTAALNAFLKSTANNSCVAFVRATYQVSGTLLISEKSGLEIRGNDAVLAAGTQADRNRRHVVIAKSSNVTIHDLHVRGANQQHLRSQAHLEAQHGFELADHSSDIRLVNVHVDEVYGDAIYIGGDSSNVVVQGGTFSYTGRQGIAMSAARNVTFDGFVLRNAGRHCIDLEPYLPRQLVEQVTIRNTNSTCRKQWLILHSGTVHRVYSANNIFEGRQMPEGRLVPGVYPK